MTNEPLATDGDEAASARSTVTLQETDLYAPIHDYLVAQGYTVRSEVKGCDITATKGDDLIVIELKRGFSTHLLIQATERQRFADSVYVALPRPAGASRSHWRGVQHLLRRLELGLILVSFPAGLPYVDIVFHPESYEPKGKPRRRRAVLQEIANRSGEYNQGGSSSKRRILTAYREAVLLVACALDLQSPSSPAALVALGTGPKTQGILSRNNYGWFEKIERGVYGLSAAGREALTQYPDLVAHFKRTLGERNEAMRRE
jgi:hypothetical protein